MKRSYSAQVLSFLGFVCSLITTSCGGGNGGDDSSSQRLPRGFPSQVEPSQTKSTPEKVFLGRYLFYDKALSFNRSQSCATCHVQARAFTDGRTVAVGSTGQAHSKNTPSIANAGYQITLTWGNPLLSTLEEQVLIPLFGDNPVELGMGGKEGELINRLKETPLYRRLFSEAYGSNAEITVGRVVESLVSFERSIVSGRSLYDRHVYDKEPNALSQSAKRGLTLFFSERLECQHCHSGLLLGSPASHEGASARRSQFENNGLYNIRGRYPPGSEGLEEFSQNPSDNGKMRPPSLRNVEVTAPYMHDGSIASLNDVIDHYARGGRTLQSGSNKGDGKINPNKNGLVLGFSLSPGEREDLLNFLRSLTDNELLNNPALSNPFEK
jgi:cytochrome c peroxidase